MAWLNVDDEGNRAEMEATVTELDPPRLLELSGDIHGVLRFELAADGDETVLTFTSTLDLPGRVPDEGARRLALSTSTRWQPRWRAGRPTSWTLPGWDAVHERYLQSVE